MPSSTTFRTSTDRTAAARTRTASAIGAAVVILAGTGLLAAPSATAVQATADGGSNSCSLEVWYAVHNPSIAKPRRVRELPNARPRLCERRASAR